MMDQPYISFVVVARNDNHGEDFLSRMDAFVRNIIVLSEKCHLPCELIVVEWNPPGDRPRLREALSWPDIRREFIRIRIVEVPGEVHQKLPNPRKLQLFEFVGKNVGLRHARAEYILTTNSDTLFNEDLVKFLASQRLHRGHFYRIDRRDVKMPLPVATVENQLRYCQENVIQVYGYFWSRYDRKIGVKLRRCRQMRALAAYTLARIRMFPAVPLHCNAAGDFLLMHRDHWDAMQGFPELETQGTSQHIDSLAVHMAEVGGLRQIILKSPMKLYHQDHSRPEPDRPMSAAVRDAMEEVRKTGCLPRAHVRNITWGLGRESLAQSSL